MKKEYFNSEQQKENTTLNQLIDEILQWPAWKLEAMCLDETDVEIKHFIEERRAATL